MKSLKLQDGVAALETALVFPAVLLVIFLIVDLGVFFFDYVSANNAVREGARCGAVGHSDVTVQNRVQVTSGFTDPVLVSVNRTGGRVGDDIIVTGDFDHDWILPANLFSVPDSFSVSTTMRLESVQAPQGQCGVQ